MTIRERAKQLKTDVPALFLALKARETPCLAKAFAAITVAYALSPRSNSELLDVRRLLHYIGCRRC